MAEYVESKEKSQKAALEAQKAKLQALEKQLGIDTPAASASSIGAASGSGTASAPVTTSSSGGKQADVDVTKIAQKRHRFDDTQYLETSREINDGVRNAVAAGEFGTHCGNVNECTHSSSSYFCHRSTKEAEEGQDGGINDRGQGTRQDRRPCFSQ
jgi:hypothetical protein